MLTPHPGSPHSRGRFVSWVHRTTVLVEGQSAQEQQEPASAIPLLHQQVNKSSVLGTHREKPRGGGAQDEGTASARALGQEWTWLLAGCGEPRGGRSGVGSWTRPLGPGLQAAVILCWVRHWRSMRWGLASAPGASRSRYAPVQALTSEKCRRAGGGGRKGPGTPQEVRVPQLL